MTTFNDNTPLGEARDWLRNRVEEGATCPTCTQNAKVYRRKITSRQAKGLILVYRAAGTSWVHVPSVDPSLAGDGGELSRLRYWGLIQEADAQREDGGRAGWWRITAKGERFILGQLTVPKYARVYAGRFLGMVRTSPKVSIHDALNEKFSYRDLMDGV